ncbi:hypothetical protein RRG08_062557 [Elysia crispata]|uniref:Uncharacterized protein n=1 Tax=Elysia crispata TaxID=231223 RepID=A0AAE1AMB9_9GAST|nr:hypothetical protein RRG08_062557 [Elysia crispata]
MVKPADIPVMVLLYSPHCLPQLKLITDCSRSNHRESEFYQRLTNHSALWLWNENEQTNISNDILHEPDFMS